MGTSNKELETLKELLKYARLIEYSVSFILTLLISMMLLNRVRFKLESFTYLVMAILLFT